MMLENNATDDTFIVRSSDPNKPSQSFTCQAATPELQQQWLSTIGNILQTQKDFLKAIESPIAYQKELTKEAWVCCWLCLIRRVTHLLWLWPARDSILIVCVSFGKWRMRTVSWERKLQSMKLKKFCLVLLPNSPKFESRKLLV